MVPASSICKRGEQQHAAEHAEIMAAPAGDQRAADHHHGDRRQKIVVAHAQACLARKAGQHNADNRRTDGGEHVDENDGALDARSLRVAPRAARCRCRRPGVRRACGRAAAAAPTTKTTMSRTTGVSSPILAGHEPAQHRRGKAGRRALRIEQRATLQDAVGGKRHDDRRDAEHRRCRSHWRSRCSMPIGSTSRQGVEQEPHRSR